MVGLALVPTLQCPSPQACSVPAVWMGKGSLVHAQGLAAAAAPLTLPKRNNSAQGMVGEAGWSWDIC